MLDVNGIERAILDLAKNSFDPVSNFNCAVEYERLNQTSSAAFFYLRAAEWGHETHPLIAYNALLKMALCYGRQPNRVNTVASSLLHAVTFMPQRPEGHFLLAQYYERNTKWQECYTQASMGLMTAINTYNNPLTADVGYYGTYCLLFEKAVSGWWLGQKDEAKKIFDDLLVMDVAPEYKLAIENNLKLFK
jgi:hypothetical protein